MSACRKAVLWLVALTAVLAAPTPGALAAEAERITSYDVVLAVAPDGDLEVRERIAYDLGPNAVDRHGIYRTIPTRVPFDQDRDRVYRLSDVEVTSPTGAPDDVEENEDHGYAQLRIGHPDRTISGRHVYDIAYRIEGALNAFPDHVELYWNAIGGEWDVPITNPTVRVVAPAQIQRQACFAGPAGSTLPCASTTPTSPREVTFAHPAGLPASAAFTVVIGLPKDSVSATGPVLEERYTLRRALTPTPLTGSLAALILLFGRAATGIRRRGC